MKNIINYPGNCAPMRYLLCDEKTLIIKIIHRDISAHALRYSKDMYLKEVRHFSPDQVAKALGHSSVYKKTNPSHEIEFLDLYQEKIENLDQDQLEKLFSDSDSIMSKYARQFADSDRYIIAAPMWNLSFPAILKSYIDYITIPGITLNYTEKGSIGLLAGKGKKAIHITARGGVYSSGPAAEYEMGDRYLKTLLQFFGIDQIETLAIEGTNYFVGSELEARVKEALTNAERMAKVF